MPAEGTPQKQAVMGMIRDLESHLEVQATAISIEDLWNSNPPDDANGEKLHYFLDGVGCPSVILYLADNE